jgi:hypothetical protein
MSAREAPGPTGAVNLAPTLRRERVTNAGKRGRSRYRVDVTAKPSSLTGSVAVMDRRRLEARERTLGRLDIDELGRLNLHITAAGNRQ